MKVSVKRGDSYQEFEVPRHPSQTVLDVVTYIQRHLDPTLAYRFACRVGMCGSCAMMVNGVPRWTCRTHVDKVAAGDRLEVARVSPQSKNRKLADAGIECIGCAVCYAACDVVKWNPDYLGPAALNRAWTLVKDVRDRSNLERLRAVSGDAGCHACHSHVSCTERCPKHLSPTAAIAGLKREVAKAVLRGEL